MTSPVQPQTAPIRLSEWPTDRPLWFDTFAAALITVLHVIIVYADKYLFTTEFDSLIDILNELISASIATGSFIFTALAIIASLRVRRSVIALEMSSDLPRSDLVIQNDKNFRKLVRVYGYACRVYVFLFLYFLLLRTIAKNIGTLYLLHAMIPALVFMAGNYIRCVYMLQRVLVMQTESQSADLPIAEPSYQSPDNEQVRKWGKRLKKVSIILAFIGFLALVWYLMTLVI